MIARGHGEGVSDNKKDVTEDSRKTKTRRKPDAQDRTERTERKGQMSG